MAQNKSDSFLFEQSTYHIWYMHFESLVSIILRFFVSQTLGKDEQETTAADNISYMVQEKIENDSRTWWTAMWDAYY